MSLFRKPKKPIQRRVFSGYSDEEDIENNDTAVGSHSHRDEKMHVDDGHEKNSHSSSRDRNNSSSKKDKKSSSSSSTNYSNSGGTTTTTSSGTSSKEKSQNNAKTSLLSFDDEEEGEVFQVKKSSHSKKVMKMLDKERRKKKHKSTSSSERSYDNNGTSISSLNTQDNRLSSSSSMIHNVTASSGKSDNHFNDLQGSDTNNKFNKRIKNENSNSNVQTEIRTDDFVLVVKKTEPENFILNGRAALCAGRDDMSSEDDDAESDTDVKHSNTGGVHKFNHPDNFKMVLESGAIPDAAMIHAARKRRQEAREQSEFIPIDEPPQDKKNTRLMRDDGEDDGSDEEERVDMSAITGIKEREERREKFYSAQQEYSGEESDPGMNEWENQQIRKGVTGAQLVTAQQESVFSQFMIQPSSSSLSNDHADSLLSTGALLEQAYAKGCLDKPRQVLISTQLNEQKPTGPRMPGEVLQNLRDRLVKLKEINQKHCDDIERLTREMKLAEVEEIDCEHKAPVAAVKYRFYQEMKCYISDLVECFDEKLPVICDLEKRAISLMAKRTLMFVERRRQDVRDQAKEMTDQSKSGIRKGADDEEHTRRAAEREGRRTRRRRDRERNELSETHLDGMSSDDEIADHEINTYKSHLDQIQMDSEDVFTDASEEFYQIDEILNKFDEWKKFDMDSYREAYVTICLPKIIGPIIRLKLITWSPLAETSTDIEKMLWYNIVMKYGYSMTETEQHLASDPDVRFVPAIIEKIILPKITEHIENCWDPLSTTQTLKLVGLIGRLGREYPSLRPTSKMLKTLFISILDKMKLSLDNDVFIPIFPKYMQEAKTSFFQRQFCSGLKLFRNFLSWQGILSDTVLKEIALLSLLNRYLVSAMRVCTPIDAISKAAIIVNTIPRVWLHPDTGVLESMEMFITFLKNISNGLDKKNSSHLDSIEKVTTILLRLHAAL